MTKERFEGFEVVCLGTDYCCGKLYRVSDETFYQLFAVDEDLFELLPSPLGGVNYTLLKDYGKFIKKATKALHNFLSVPIEE